MAVLEKNFSYKDIWQIFFSIPQSNTEENRLWCYLAALVAVMDGTGEKESNSLLDFSDDRNW